MDIPAIFGGLTQILNIISEGGPKSIMAILFISSLVMAFANYFVVKFVVNFTKEQSAARDKVVGQKDEMIRERISKFEEIIEKYNKSQIDSTEAIRRLESFVHDIKTILDFILKQMK